MSLKLIYGIHSHYTTVALLLLLGGVNLLLMLTLLSIVYQLDLSPGYIRPPARRGPIHAGLRGSGTSRAGLGGTAGETTSLLAGPGLGRVRSAVRRGAGYLYLYAVFTVQDHVVFYYVTVLVLSPQIRRPCRVRKCNGGMSRGGGEWSARARRRRCARAGSGAARK